MKQDFSQDCTHGAPSQARGLPDLTYGVAGHAQTKLLREAHVEAKSWDFLKCVCLPGLSGVGQTRVKQ